MISNTTNFPQGLGYNQTFNSGGTWSLPWNIDGMPTMMTGAPNQAGYSPQVNVGMNQAASPNSWMQAGFSPVPMTPSTTPWWTTPITGHSGRMNLGSGYRGGDSNADYNSPKYTTFGTANVRFKDNDSETVIEIQVPGFMTEMAEISIVADQIRVRFPNPEDKKGFENPMMLVLPMPAFGDVEKIQAAAANDFLRISIETRKEIANNIKKIKPNKIK